MPAGGCLDKIFRYIRTLSERQDLDAKLLSAAHECGWHGEEGKERGACREWKAIRKRIDKVTKKLHRQEHEAEYCIRKGRRS